jgi:glycosyltransferase involved in cell wall biosynthesis
MKEPIYEFKDSFLQALKFATRWKRNVREIVHGTDMVLPNSEEEMLTLRKDIGIKRKINNLVVPNAFERVKFSKYNKEKLIVCVGRIEQRKNCLKVIRAFKKSKAFNNGFVLKLIGSVNSNHRNYFKRVKNELDGEKIIYLGEKTYKETQKIFARAAITILASYFETTGLTGIEALYQGSTVIMTKYNYNEYYYGDNVIYCNPYSENTIAESIDLAVNGIVDIKEKNKIYFSWKDAAKKTLQAYKTLLV